MNSSLNQPDLFQPERAEPYDFTVSFGDPPGLLRAMEREGIPPRMMDDLRGRYRLRGSARPSVLARVLKEANANPVHLLPTPKAQSDRLNLVSTKQQRALAPRLQSPQPRTNQR